MFSRKSEDMSSGKQQQQHHGGTHAAESEKANFQGKYKWVRNEEFEEYLKAIGFCWYTRKIMLITTPPELVIVQEGDAFIVKFDCQTQNKKDLAFTVGQEFEDTQHCGKPVKVFPAWEGKKLVLTIEPMEEGKGRKEKQTRELLGDELVHTFEVGNVYARRIFKKVDETDPN